MVDCKSLNLSTFLYLFTGLHYCEGLTSGDEEPETTCVSLFSYLSQIQSLELQALWGNDLAAADTDIWKVSDFIYQLEFRVVLCFFQRVTYFRLKWNFM